MAGSWRRMSYRARQCWRPPPKRGSSGTGNLSQRSAASLPSRSITSGRREAMKAMRAAQLKHEELDFLIQVGRIIRQCRLANQNAALLDQFLAEHDCRFHGQYPRRHTK